MLNNIKLGRYLKVDSYIHNLNPLFKIISLVIMIISIFFVDSYLDILVLFLYLIIAIMYTNIDIKVYLKSLSSIKIFLIFIIVLDLIFFVSLKRVVIDTFKLIFIIMYSSILTFTTTITELTYGIEKFLSPFKKIIPVSDIAIMISLSLRYIPTLTSEADRIVRSEKLRGVNFDTKNYKEKINNIISILLPLLSLTLRKSNITGDIMDIRLYNYSKSKTNYHTNSWKLIDSLLLILNIVILVIVVYY